MFGLLGLAPVQEAVYRAVLDWPYVSVDELVEKLGLTPEEIWAALDDLLELRIMRTSHEQPDRHYAVDPVLALQELLEREQKDLLERYQKVVAGHTTILRMLLAQETRGTSTPRDGAGCVQRLVGMDAVQQRLEMLAQEVRRSVTTFMPGGPQSAAALEAARRNDRIALDRGVVIRTVGLDCVRQDEATLEYARWLTEHGGEFRTAQTLPPRMVLVDRQTALVPIDPRDTRKGALFLTEPGLVASLAAFFEQVWEAATPLGADRLPGATGLSAQEKRLLMVIAQGHTDETAAAKLFVSPRTARRMMASIMERLGARSRFEAGLRAAQNGWL
ncbi:transcriptional regulator, LuxR family [Actinobacteria bacterium OK074]|nr:transcriptional regulator, LuxR family [Actinobacteria bacterium OK074]